MSLLLTHSMTSFFPIHFCRPCCTSTILLWAPLVCSGGRACHFLLSGQTSLSHNLSSQQLLCCIILRHSRGVPGAFIQRKVA